MDVEGLDQMQSIFFDLILLFAGCPCLRWNVTRISMLEADLIQV